MKTICRVLVLLLLVSSVLHAQANSAPLTKEERIAFVENVRQTVERELCFPGYRHADRKTS